MSYSFADLPEKFQRRFLEQHIEGKYLHPAGTHLDPDWDESSRVGHIPALVHEFKKDTKWKPVVQYVRDYIKANSAPHHPPDAREIVKGIKTKLDFFLLYEMRNDAESFVKNVDNYEKRQKECEEDGIDPNSDWRCKQSLLGIHSMRIELKNNIQKIDVWETALEQYENYLENMANLVTGLHKQGHKDE